MAEKNNYAVLTGDVINSSKLKEKEKTNLISCLKQSFGDIEKMMNDGNLLPSFEIFRGDSFQGVLLNPVDAMRAGLLIRASLQKNQPANSKADWDARISIGIGTIDYLPESVSEGDGAAYRNSGPVLDELKGEKKFALKTPWQAINGEFYASCALLDAVINKWTQPQAEIVYMLLRDKTPKKIGKELDISQAAVHYRVKGAGWFAVEAFLKRYEAIITESITS